MTTQRTTISRRREARREVILDAAMRIVMDGGFDALTMPRLASELDAAVGALYRYFSGKDEVIAGLQRRSLAHFEEFLVSRLEKARTALADAPAPVAALAVLVEMAEAWFDHAQVSPARHQLMDAVLSAPRALLPDATARQVEVVLAPILERVGGLLSEAVDVGALGEGDAAVRTHLLWAGVHGLDHFRKRDRFQSPSLTARALTHALLDSLLRGWGASEEDLAAAALARSPRAARE